MKSINQRESFLKHWSDTKKRQRSKPLTSSGKDQKRDEKMSEEKDTKILSPLTGALSVLSYTPKASFADLGHSF